MAPLPTAQTAKSARLTTVMLHRPGNELKRLTPRNNDKLLFDGIPWVSRAQEEHDAFAETLRERGVEVLYLTELLTETLASEEARAHAISSALSGLHLGDTLRDYLAVALAEASPEELTGLLTEGIRNDEVRGGHGLVTSLLSPYDFLIDPLPNLLFTRDSSVWVRDRVAITSLAMPARKRETQLTELIYTEHPRFAGQTQKIHGWHNEHVEGGDVLLLAPGVIAVGVGERTTPAGVERLARQVFHADLAHTVLAVPIAQERATMHLDTVCTMVDVDKVVMYPNVAHTLMAHAVTVRERGETDTDLVLDVGRPSRSWSRPPRRCRSTPCTRSTPASTRSPPSASSGTTATTPWPSPRGSRSPTSATTRPTTASRRPASRSSGSPARSWARVAAARAACPARSSGSRCRDE